MKWLLVLGVGLLIGIGICGELSLAEQEVPETVVFQGKGKLGSVSFSHKVHADQRIKCEMCHHTGIEGGKCAGCHDDNPSIPRTQDSFHLLCAGCHKHKRMDVSCEHCHRD